MADPAVENFLPELKSWDEVIAAYDRDESVRTHTKHNLDYWRSVHGGLALVRKSPLEFDPVAEYWFKTERRVLVAYFGSRFAECYAPADALRGLALRTFRHFDTERETGRFGEPVLAEKANWATIGQSLLTVTESLPDDPRYQNLKRYWARLKAPSLRDDLVAYLQKALEFDNPDPLDPSYYRRLAWFPYIGLPSLDRLLDRQRFFFGFYELFASTNAYAQGGAMAFAPVLQNNPTGYLLDFVERWEAGQRPDETGFEVEGKTGRRDISHVTTVAEFYGLLNLHSQPFYNNRTYGYYEKLQPDNSASRFAVMAAVGSSCKSYLSARPKAVERLASEIRELCAEDLHLDLLMEGIALSSVEKKLPDEVKKQADITLHREMQEAARDKATALGDLDAAATFLHLMLDACLYQRSILVVTPEPTTPEPRIPEVADVIELPPSLRMIANDALGFLKAGHHVLFAGAPGTGKTTLAQIVGHAWNTNRDEVSSRIPRNQAPATTVGNSAWAPFHTIGGILPDDRGGFRLVRGIFIDKDDSKSDTWTLRSDCLVLDEMNRADLDRCIGELYPLLSWSVDEVHPAGIPGVRSIRLNPRFRVIATVNDTTIDDVVFPISEGLARRFVRIELAGARMDELEAFLMLDETQGERADAARSIIENLYELLRDNLEILHSTEQGERLPFGVGYFSLLRAWVRGDLRMSQEFEEREPLDQAAYLTMTGLRSAARFRGLQEILEKLQVKEALD